MESRRTASNPRGRNRKATVRKAVELDAYIDKPGSVSSSRHCVPSSPAPLAGKSRSDNTWTAPRHSVCCFRGDVDGLIAKVAAPEEGWILVRGCTSPHDRRIFLAHTFVAVMGEEHPSPRPGCSRGMNTQTVVVAAAGGPVPKAAQGLEVVVEAAAVVDVDGWSPAPPRS